MSPLERATKASWENSRSNYKELFGYAGPSWEQAQEVDRKRTMANFRAGLEALMELTPEMHVAGVEALSTSPMPSLEIIWQAMLKEAMK